MIFFFQPVLEEGCAWGGSNGWGFGPAVWVGLVVAKFGSLELGSWGFPLLLTGPWDRLHEPLVLENSLKKTVAYKNPSYHQRREGVLSQLKDTVGSAKDLVGVSLIIWIHKCTLPSPKCLIFQTHVILSLGPPSSPEVSPSWFKASPVPPGLYSQSFLI